MAAPQLDLGAVKQSAQRRVQMLGAAADGSFLAPQLSPATDAFGRRLSARRCGFPTLNNLEFIEGKRSSPSMLFGLDFAPWREGIMLHTVELKGFIVLVLLRLLRRFWMLDSRRRSRSCCSQEFGSRFAVLCSLMEKNLFRVSIIHRFMCQVFWRHRCAAVQGEETEKCPASEKMMTAPAAERRLVFG